MKIVTSAAVGVTRRSRIGSATGLTTSPARPTRNSALKPIVVATKRWLRRVGVNGFSNAPHRQARTRNRNAGQGLAPTRLLSQGKVPPDRPRAAGGGLTTSAARPIRGYLP